MTPKLSYHFPGDRFVKRNKYSARSMKCLNPDHAVHKSMLEADQCNVLRASKVPYCAEFKVELVVAGVRVANHYIDFAVFKSWRSAALRRNPIKFIETKGYATDLWKLKRKITEALNPKIPYEVLGEKPGFYTFGKKFR